MAPPPRGTRSGQGRCFVRRRHYADLLEHLRKKHPHHPFHQSDLQGTGPVACLCGRPALGARGLSHHPLRTGCIQNNPAQPEENVLQAPSSALQTQHRIRHSQSNSLCIHLACGLIEIELITGGYKAKGKHRQRGRGAGGGSPKRQPISPLPLSTPFDRIHSQSTDIASPADPLRARLPPTTPSFPQPYLDFLAAIRGLSSTLQPSQITETPSPSIHSTSPSTARPWNRARGLRQRRRS